MLLLWAPAGLAVVASVFATAALGGPELALLATFPFIVWGSDELRRWLRRRTDADRVGEAYGERR